MTFVIVEPGPRAAGAVVPARRRSTLAEWMRRHHAALAAEFDRLHAAGRQPSWPALVEELVRRKVVPKGTSPHTLRSCWARTRAWAAAGGR